MNLKKFLFIFCLSFSCQSQAHRTNFSIENRIRIAIVETGMNVTEKTKPFLCRGLSKSLVIDSPFRDDVGHGTCVASLIIQSINPKTHCIVVIKYWKKNIDEATFVKNEIDGINYAVKIKARFINLSLGGGTFYKKEYEALAKAIKHKIKIAVASGNDSGKGFELDSKGKRIFKGIDKCRIVKGNRKCGYLYEWGYKGQNLDMNCNYFPACYNFPQKYFHVVGSSTGYLNQWGGMHYYGNYGSRVKYEEDGTDKGEPSLTGTSMSTAIHTGKWASGKIP